MTAPLSATRLRDRNLAASHMRDTDAARRTLAGDHARRSSAATRAWDQQTTRDELAGSIAALVNEIHAPLDRIAADHRRMMERFGIGGKS